MVEGTPGELTRETSSRRVFHLKFSLAEYERRYRALRERMGEQGIDCLLVYGAGRFHNQQNLLYLSNYTDTLQAYVVLPLEDEPTLLVNGIWHVPNAREMSPIVDVRWGGPRMPEVAAERIRETGHAAGRIGLVGVDSWRQVSMPYRHYETLRRELPEAQYMEATELVESVRAIRSAEEVEVVRLGAALTDSVFEAMKSAVRPGVREFELLAEARYHAEREGGRLVVGLLGSTSMSNPTMAYPWPNPTDRAIRAGDVVLSELSAAVAGYSGQLIRPIFLGEPSQLYRQLFQVAVGVYQGVRKALRPGNTDADVLAASQLIQESEFVTQAPVLHGWTNRFSPPLVGFSNENPWHVSTVFEAGQTVMIEPNPATPDLTCGLFFGDLQLITTQGSERLHNVTNEPIVV
jgi:Xaa-Pro aminopeptidase